MKNYSKSNLLSLLKIRSVACEGQLWVFAFRHPLLCSWLSKCIKLSLSLVQIAL